MTPEIFITNRHQMAKLLNLVILINSKVGLMCNNVHNSAVIAVIFMKFCTNMLNQTLYDSRNFYQKQTLDGKIIQFFRSVPLFFAPPCIHQGPAKLRYSMRKRIAGRGTARGGGSAPTPGAGLGGAKIGPILYNLD